MNENIMGYDGKIIEQNGIWSPLPVTVIQHAKGDDSNGKPAPLTEPLVYFLGNLERLGLGPSEGDVNDIAS